MNLLRRLLNRLRPPRDELSLSLRVASEVACRCDDFVTDFAESDLVSIEIIEASFGTDPDPIFKHLQGGSYREIRNRFRILSNLDPVANRTEETGLIRFSYRIGDPPDFDNFDKTAPIYFRDVELRTVFPADITRFQLQKVKVGPPYKYSVS